MTLSQDEMYLELSALTSTDRPLFRSEERRRAFLVRELASVETRRGLDELRAMRAELAKREFPPEIEKEAHSGNH